MRNIDILKLITPKEIKAIENIKEFLDHYEESNDEEEIIFNYKQCLKEQIDFMYESEIIDIVRLSRWLGYLSEIDEKIFIFNLKNILFPEMLDFFIEEF